MKKHIKNLATLLCLAGLALHCTSIKRQQTSDAGKTKQEAIVLKNSIKATEKHKGVSSNITGIVDNQNTKAFNITQENEKYIETKEDTILKLINQIDTIEKAHKPFTGENFEKLKNNNEQNDTIHMITNKKKKYHDTTVYLIVDEMPTFNGGDIAMYNYLNKSIDYKNISSIKPWGKAYVKFTVNTKGKTENIIVMNENRIPDIIVERIINAIEKMPLWNPGKLQKKPVNVSKTIIIWEPL